MSEKPFFTHLPEDSIAIHFDDLSNLEDPLSRSNIPLSPDSSSFKREATEQTRAFNDASGIFLRKKSGLSSAPSSRKAPLGVGSASQNVSRDIVYNGSDVDEEISRARSYLQTQVLQNTRDSHERDSRLSPTDKYIESSVAGGINSLIHLAQLYEKSPALFFRLDIRKRAIVNDSREKMRGVPLIHRGINGEKLLVKHFDNLIQVQKPLIDNREVKGSENYLFRIIDNMPNLIRVESVKNLGSIIRVSTYICIPKDLAKKYSSLLE